MATFNKEEHKARMQPHVDKLVSYFEKKGIAFQPNDEKHENVIFASKEKAVRISHHSFYRYSGIACIYKEGKEKNHVEAVEVTDAMFMDMFMKTIIEALFGLKE